MYCPLLVHVQIKLNVLTLFGQRNLFCCLTWKLGDEDCCLGFIPSNRSRWMDSDNHWTSSVRREGEREREREREKQIREEDSNKRARVQHGTKYHNEEDLLLLLLYSCSQAPQVGFCHKTHYGPMCVQHTTLPLTNTQTRMSVS